MVEVFHCRIISANDGADAAAAIDVFHSLRFDPMILDRADDGIGTEAADAGVVPVTAH
jgi:hypothetical protein